MRETALQHAAARLASANAHKLQPDTELAKIIDTRWREPDLDSDDDEAVEVHDDEDGAGGGVHCTTFENCDDEA